MGRMGRTFLGVLQIQRMLARNSTRLGGARPAGMKGLPLYWAFAVALLAQLGHLIEHISAAIQGRGLFGPQLDSEVSHLVFNSAIAVFSVALAAMYRRNPWVYPLVVIALFHGVEHVYIYDQFTKTGVSDGPGLLGIGGLIGVVPLDRLDLHNVYNGFEMILMVLGFWNEAEVSLLTAEQGMNPGKVSVSGDALALPRSHMPSRLAGERTRPGPSARRRRP